VKAINDAIPYFNVIPMTIDSFTMLLPPEAEFHSTGGGQFGPQNVEKVVFKAKKSKK